MTVIRHPPAIHMNGRGVFSVLWSVSKLSSVACALSPQTEPYFTAFTVTLAFFLPRTAVAVILALPGFLNVTNPF